MTLGERVFYCYLMTPFRDEFRQLRQLIADTLLEMNVQPVLWEHFPATTQSIAEALQNQIQRADIVIADLTDNNPNVMYELGYAHALGKPTLMLAQNASRQIPFNLSSYLYIAYDPQQPQQLQDAIRVWIPRIIERIDTEASEI